jgi:hypothetical protein
MGLCGSTVNDGDKVGATHTVNANGGAASPNDVTVAVDDDESAVYADTVRLVSTQILKRLSATLKGELVYSDIAVSAYTGKQVDGFDLVAHKQWSEYYRAVWDVKNAEKGGGDDPKSRFDSLLASVESGVAYRKPGPALAIKPASIDLLNVAVTEQSTLLQKAIDNCLEDQAVAKEQLILWLGLFKIFDPAAPLQIGENIDKICAS